MKEMNGTVTLAFVEEDNKQRVIFRVFPLCTREGEMMLGNKELFPDDGSLRIVPDKREQSTFKERMREIGGLCAINLVADGRELIKVRQNRNYAPEQGERNQQAIYSDVICEFAPGACFEVVQAGCDASSALTEQVLIQNGMLLVGPVAREAAQSATLADLKPFGDDTFLLHQLSTERLGDRRICWNPEALLNWRQRRNALRRKERGHNDEEKRLNEAEKPSEQLPDAEKPSRNPENAVPEDPKHEVEREQPKQKPERLSRKERKAAEAPAAKHAEMPKPVVEEATEAAPAVEEETALPIGAHLEILDQGLSFDQHISRLAQPLSSSANRLSTEETIVEEEEVIENAVHFNGTPLNRNARQITHSMRKPETVAHVVERSLVKSNAFQDGQSGYQYVENPVERLLVDMEYVWQNNDLRRHALSELLENDAFMQDMFNAFRSRGYSTKTTVAAREQMMEIEAERLDLLMQLDAAKDNEKKYRENALASLSHKLKGESERLKREVSNLEKTRDALQRASQTLSLDVADKTREYMAKNITCLSGNGENHVLLAPVVGKRYTTSEMAENLRQHVNNNGFAISEDEAMGLLVLFSISNHLCLCADTQDDAARFATLMMESFGLQSVSAHLKPDCHVELMSLLPENELRTPTVTIQPIGTETMNVFGHKTVYVADADATIPMFMPVFRVPRHLRSTYGNSGEWETIIPASIETFSRIRSDVHPLLSEAESWFSDLKNAMKEQQLCIPEVTLEDMRRFMEAGMRRVRGGFVAAADIAVCHWIAPVLNKTACNDSMRQVLNGLPRTLELLNIE